MGTVSGANLRRYHGHLVAATEPPADRTALLATIEMEIQGEGNPVGLSCNQYPGAIYPEGHQYLESFSVGGSATWTYRAEGMVLDKSLAMHPGLNAVSVRYSNSGKKPFRLILRPLVCFKPHHGNFRFMDFYPQALNFPKNKTVVDHEGVSLVLRHEGARRMPAVGWYYRFEYTRELERGLDPRDDLFCPCELQYELLPGESAVLCAATKDGIKPMDPWPENLTSLSLAEGLKDAAEKFFVQTPARTSIIAGYPWFTDWGRDTMISISGICLHTGKVEAARKIILDYGSQLKDGLIPNRFVEGGEQPEYNTVDATLWFANAIYQTLQADWEPRFAMKCLKLLHQIVDAHLKGTKFGIGVDKHDGLLKQGEHGVQLTWMDAKIGDWVVTPRYGKPIEINGLWINALRVAEWLAFELEEEPSKFTEAADFAEMYFEKKFWRKHLGFYLDTIEPDDASLRPNQLIAMSLPFSPLKGDKAKQALQKCTEQLLTPVGLRSLAPSSPNYRGQFRGHLPDLDAAYHQGTVWPWLMGPYVTALVKLTGDRAEAKRILKAGRDLLNEYGLGGIAEVYDGDEPRAAGGCPWQAWSTAEWLRAWVEDAGGS